MPLVAEKLPLGIEDHIEAQLTVVTVTLALLLHRLESCSVCLSVPGHKLKNYFEKYETVTEVMAHLDDLTKILGRRRDSGRTSFTSEDMGGPLLPLTLWTMGQSPSLSELYVP